MSAKKRFHLFIKLYLALIPLGTVAFFFSGVPIVSLDSDVQLDYSLVLLRMSEAFVETAQVVTFAKTTTTTDMEMLGPNADKNPLGYVIFGILRIGAFVCAVGAVFSAFEAYVVRGVERVAEARRKFLERQPVNIFISYRRLDTGGYAGRLFEKLATVYGPEHVFMDIDSIRAGEDFEAVIRYTLRSTDIALTLIGPQWTGGTKIRDSEDFVRLEVEMCLKENIPIIPVLVGGASMPNTGALPKELQPLLKFNAAVLSDRRWDHDVQALIDSVQSIPARSQTE